MVRVGTEVLLPAYSKRSPNTTSFRGSSPDYTLETRLTKTKTRLSDHLAKQKKKTREGFKLFSVPQAYVLIDVRKLMNLNFITESIFRPM